MARRPPPCDHPTREPAGPLRPHRRRAHLDLRRLSRDHGSENAGAAHGGVGGQLRHVRHRALLCHAPAPRAHHPDGNRSRGGGGHGAVAVRRLRRHAAGHRGHAARRRDVAPQCAALDRRAIALPRRRHRHPLGAARGDPLHPRLLRLSIPRLPRLRGDGARGLGAAGPRAGQRRSPRAAGDPDRQQPHRRAPAHRARPARRARASPHRADAQPGGGAAARRR